VASYLFPAGGQRGTTVDVHVGGLFLYQSCGFELLGPGVEAGRQVKRTRTLWFEGPLLPLPDSQQAEDYPQDMAGQVRIAEDAPLGLRSARVWTAEGAASGLKFMVGDLPEVVEHEVDGDPVPVDVTLPVTINGRIFPRENVDVWAFPLRKGQTACCEVHAARLGSPLDSRLEVLDPQGRVIAENDDAFGADSYLHFTAPGDGKYRVRIHDTNFRGGPAYVYRLTLTTGPRVERSYPLGGRRGSKTRFEFVGPGLPSEAVEVTLPADGPRDFHYQYPVGGKVSAPVLLDLDDLPEVLETEPNDDPGQAKLVTLPAVLNGRIDRPGDVDHWAFAARKGVALALELRAQQLGAPLQGVLTVCDASGKELARAEAAAADPVLSFTAPADGTYCVRVADRFRSRGGPEYAYRLRIAPPPPPGFRLQLPADVLTLSRGGTAKLKVTAERRGGFAEAIPLTVEGLPAGVKVANNTIPAKQSATELVFTAEKSALIEGSRIQIRGSVEVGGEAVTQTAALPALRGVAEVDSVLLAVALPVPFKVVGDYDQRLAPRGTIHRRRYKIERGGYDGPLEVSLADRQMRHLQGVTGPTITVPAGVSEFEYPLQLPPWMEIGRTCRACVMAVGVIKEPNGEHTVSFSSVGQNEQIVAVVETGQLGLELEKASLSAKRGQAATVAVKVARGQGLRGPVKLELLIPEHIRGVTAEPVVLAAEASRGTFTLRFASEPLGPFNMPLVLRATLPDASGPMTAEAKLELVPEE
jgi:hypothetical protein